jgi:hypothetical protein
MGWVVKTTPRPIYPREKTGIGIGCVGPRARLNGFGNLASPGFDLRTVQPVESRYTDCTTPDPFIHMY